MPTSWPNIRDICTFAVLCSVNRPFCLFTCVYEEHVDFMGVLYGGILGRVEPLDPGGGGYLTKFNTGRLHPGLTPHPFIYHFVRKRTPFKGPFKYLNDRFPYPFIYLNL